MGDFAPERSEEAVSLAGGRQQVRHPTAMSRVIDRVSYSPFSRRIDKWLLIGGDRDVMQRTAALRKVLRCLIPAIDSPHSPKYAGCNALEAKTWRSKRLDCKDSLSNFGDL